MLEKVDLKMKGLAPVPKVLVMDIWLCCFCFLICDEAGHHHGVEARELEGREMRREGRGGGREGRRGERRREGGGRVEEREGGEGERQTDRQGECP